MIEIRFTLPLKYDLPSCDGYNNLKAREGHYQKGATFQEAVHTACRRYPNDPIDVQYKNDDYVGRYMLRNAGTNDEVAVLLPPGGDRKYRPEQMDVRTVCRFHSRLAADLVAQQMRRLTNTDIVVNHDPVSQSERERGVGDYAICALHNGNSYNNYRFSACMDSAIMLALVNALHGCQPSHPLCHDIWHLRQENQGKGHRYKIEG